ncbi:hypothetical protein ES704_02080 [subsurface metagenome]|jgi:hypothetical protein
MTKEEILAMKAGRELDVLVSAKVMEHRMEHRIEKYSTDISAAWLVVEKLSNLIFDLRKVYQNTDWCASFEGNVAEGKKAPEAICKAALLAKLEAVT